MSWLFITINSDGTGEWKDAEDPKDIETYPMTWSLSGNKITFDIKNPNRDGGLNSFRIIELTKTTMTIDHKGRDDYGPYYDYIKLKKEIV